MSSTHAIPRARRSDSLARRNNTTLWPELAASTVIIRGRNVIGATGRTGTTITALLLQAGERVRALGRSERKLSELERAGADVSAGDATDAAHVLLLRAALLFESFHDALELIAHQGINGDAVAPGVALPMIATRDIADVAATALRARDWTGVVVRELGFSENVAGLYVEMTRAFNDGLVKSCQGRTPETSTPTRFEDFATELARAYQSA